MGYHYYFIGVLSFFACTLLPAQTDTYNADLERASELLGSRTTLLMDATGHLIFLQRDDYDVVRKDRIAMVDIDTGSIALGTDGTIRVACHQGRMRCVQSIIYRADQELRSSTLRITAPTDTTQANSAVAAILSILGKFDEVAELQNETSAPTLRSNGTRTITPP